MSDIVLLNCMTLVTQNDQRDELSDVDIYISDNRVKAIGRNLDTPGTAEKIDCRNKLVIPGLINTHHHFFQTFQRNIPAVQNAKLFDWLVQLYEIWKFLDEKIVYFSSLLGMGELLKTGCTTTTDHHYLYPRSVDGALIPAMQFKAAGELGIRFSATRGSMSMGKKQGGLPPESVVQDDDDILLQTEEAIRKYHDPSEGAMQQIHVAPCSPFNVSPRVLKESAKLARKHRVRLHTHLCETLDEEKFCLEKFGKRPFALMEDVDWVGPDVWYAHGIYFNDDELQALADYGIGIAHCPASNMRLGSGIARIREMRDLGIPVGLGVDGSASNDASDLLGELRLALLLQRVKYGADAMTARDVLEMATLGSAKVLGRKDIGSIEVGKVADIAVFDLDRLEYAGALSDPPAAIVFSGYNHGAWMTIVNGRIVVRDYKLVNVDERKIIENSNRLSFQMLKKAGASSLFIPPAYREQS